jgi:hypothetical protein
MATLHAETNGVLLRYLANATEEARYPDAPVGTAATLTIDEATNAALLADLAASTDPYRLVAGVLTKGGVPQVIAADSNETTYRKALATLLQDQRDYVGVATPTAAQTAAATKSQAKLLLLLTRALQRAGWV